MFIDVNTITFEEDEYYRVEYYPLWGRPERPDVIRIVLQYKYKHLPPDTKIIRYRFTVIMTNDHENIICGSTFTISQNAKTYIILEKI